VKLIQLSGLAKLTRLTKLREQWTNLIQLTGLAKPARLAEPHY
jgi:hypothetical protein